MRNLVLGLAVLLLTTTLSINAQEYRATIAGTVTDQSGAAVPATRLTVTNIETGVSVNAAANDQGRYVAPFLLPGRYQLRVEQAGFKTFERSPIELRINDRVELNVVLEIGQMSDKVTVVAEAPLLETSTSSRGQVIENRKIVDLPLNGRNPFQLVNLAAGVQYSGSSLTYFRPFDNGSINDFSINGGQQSMNEIQLDGVPNNAIANYDSRSRLRMCLQSRRPRNSRFRPTPTTRSTDAPAAASSVCRSSREPTSFTVRCTSTASLAARCQSVFQQRHRPGRAPNGFVGSVRFRNRRSSVHTEALPR